MIKGAWSSQANLLRERIPTPRSSAPLRHKYLSRKEAGPLEQGGKIATYPSGDGDTFARKGWGERSMSRKRLMKP
jgi:hypothetical protein